jgi:chromate transporter
MTGIGLFRRFLTERKRVDALRRSSPPRSLAELSLGFLAIGARSFGGVMPWAYRVLVEERAWLTPEDFTETIGLCQFLPGPNIGNASIVLGKRWFGIRGSIVAALALYTLPLLWVLTFAMLYSKYAAYSMVRALVTGVGAAGAGLFIATAIKLARPLAKKPAALVFIAGMFLGIGMARVSLLYVMPVSLLLAYLAARRALL